MSEKTKESLSVFMKKQISEKSRKTLHPQTSSPDAKNLEQNKAKEESALEGEEMTDEEKLEEVKKESRSKAAGRDQTEMLKKLLFENVMRYTLVVLVLVLLAVTVITIGPKIVAFFNGLIFKAIMGSIA